jgi:virulence-associated protein VagC
VNKRSQPAGNQREDRVLSPRPADWSAYLAGESVASEGFMDEIEDLPVQEREP